MMLSVVTIACPDAGCSTQGSTTVAVVTSGIDGLSHLRLTPVHWLSCLHAIPATRTQILVRPLTSVTTVDDSIRARLVLLGPSPVRTIVGVGTTRGSLIDVGLLVVRLLQLEATTTTRTEQCAVDRANALVTTATNMGDTQS